MKILLNEFELKKILDEKFGSENTYQITYLEPEKIWLKRCDIKKISSYGSALELERKYPRISCILNL